MTIKALKDMPVVTVEQVSRFRDEALATITQLQEENERLTAMLNSAINYIQESPCDPDIYPEQLKAWEKYQSLCNDYIATLDQGAADNE